MLQHPVPEGHLARMGDITVSFALVESEIQGLAWSLLSREQRVGQIVTAELSFRNLRALTLSLYRELRDEEARFQELKALMRRAEGLEHDRNQIVHSVWAAGEGETVTRIKTTAKEKQGLRFGFQPVTENDLRQVADDLKELAHDIQQFDWGLYERQS